MKGKIKDIIDTFDRKQIVSLILDEKYTGDWALLQNKPLEIEIKEYKEKRSLDINAYAWVLLDKIAKALHEDKADIYRDAIKHISGNNFIHPCENERIEEFIRCWEHNGIGWQTEVLSPCRANGYTNIRCYYGSSEYDTVQMSLLLECIIQDCKSLGIEYMTPKQLELLLGEWDNKKKKKESKSEIIQT